MQRLAILLAVAALAALAWWFARPDGGGAADGLVVHVLVLDRDGAPVHPAQVVQVYDDTRTTVDTQGRATLTNVTLRAGDEPSAEAFGYALKPLARHHALRRGFEPTASRRADGSWEVRYALHPHGILRVHVEAVNLGRGKAFLERDEPLQRWEPVGGHAVVRPGSIVDFRIYEGWDLAGGDGTLAVRLEGEPGADGLVAMASQRLKVDAPSPGHTAQLTIVPEPVDPIAGVVRVPEGPPPPTLRGRILVRHVLEDGTRVPLGEVPIDDEGGFAFRDAGPGRYELVAGLDFVPGLITTETSGGSYLELAAPGRARWVALEHPGFDATGPDTRVSVLAVHPRADPGSLPGTVRGLELARQAAWHRRAFAQPEDATDDADVRAAEMAWVNAPLLPGKDRTLVAVAGPGTWQIHLERPATFTRPPFEGEVQATLGPAASSASVPIAIAERAHGAVRVVVAPEGWGEARSARVELLGMKRTVVRGGSGEVVFPYVPRPPRVEDGDGTIHEGAHRLTVTWDDPAIARVVSDVRPDGEPVVARAVEGGHLRLRMTGPSADIVTADASILLTRPGSEETITDVELVRHGAQPVWESVQAVPPGTYEASVSLHSTVRAGPGGGFAAAYLLLPGGFGADRPPVRVEAGETTSLTYELP